MERSPTSPSTGRWPTIRYSMASLLRQVIDSGAPPSLARLPMTPEEVAASYDETEQETDDDPEFGDPEFGEPGYDDSDSDAGDGADDDNADGYDADDEVSCRGASS
jgi:hypothetical protein